jgi:hypothetical protein
MDQRGGLVRGRIPRDSRGVYMEVGKRLNVRALIQHIKVEEPSKPVPSPVARGNVERIQCVTLGSFSVTKNTNHGMGYKVKSS